MQDKVGCDRSVLNRMYGLSANTDQTSIMRQKTPSKRICDFYFNSTSSSSEVTRSKTVQGFFRSKFPGSKDAQEKIIFFDINIVGGLNDEHIKINTLSAFWSETPTHFGATNVIKKFAKI